METEVSSLLEAISEQINDSNIRQQMQRTACTFLSSRQVSSQEITYRILGLPLFKSNFDTVFLPVSFPEKRVRFLKPKYILDSMDDTDTDIFQNSIFEKYTNRPDNLENLNLSEFATSYRWFSASHVKKKLSKSFDRFISLKNNMGFIKKKNKKAILRYPQFSERKNNEEFYYSQLLLYLPWRKEPENSEDTSFYNLYQKHEQTIKDNKSKIEHHVDIIEQAIENMELLGPPRHSWDNIAPNVQQERLDELAEGTTIDSNFASVNPDILSQDIQDRTCSNQRG